MVQDLPPTFPAPTIPGYAVTEQIYNHGKTAVYRARSLTSDRSVVVKVLQLTHPSFDDLVKFRNQYTILQNLSIPGVAKPLSIEPWQNSYALVMEDGGSQSMDRYVETAGLLSVQQILSIGIQMADILNDLGQYGVIHKDIKPANIIIHPGSGRIYLIDFSAASLLSKESQAIGHPNGLEGTLSYLSPEQTGRMNRGIDYRTDFYSLGVTLYELLTGQLPFVADDPMGLIHAHIAKQPVEPDRLNPDIPAMVAAIVLKLMAKDAQDRYQSALGLKHDLEQCLWAWKESGKVPAFRLRQEDVCDRFLIPEKLYGREVEVQSLLSAFERTAAGATEIVLVAGCSGMGKTAVVQEVHKPITQQQGYFIQGKFDQFNRNIPFSGVLQAFRGLIQQLLNEPESVLAQWKQRLLNALGGNAQLMIEVIPDLELIIGPQPAVPTLSDSDHQNRFNRLLKTFIGLFVCPEHPLVMFLDDLQWADTSSLQFLQRLMAEATGHLLILGAYRHNEVTPSHPLMLVLKDIVCPQPQAQYSEISAKESAKEQTKKSPKAAVITTLTLEAMGEQDVSQLIADTLHCPVARAAQLAKWVYQKTNGNPFFTTQFLQSLYEDKLITFNGDQGGWQCDLAKVQALALTNDVLDFVITRLRRLPEETQTVLKLAACIGNQLDLSTLAVVHRALSPASAQLSAEADNSLSQRLEQIASALWPAVEEGFILPETETYKFFQGSVPSVVGSAAVSVNYRFLHDRIQQAAYALIPAREKEKIHYRIGQELKQQITQKTHAEQIFRLVNQLNHGISFIEQQTDRNELAQLNLLACQKAKAATAYDAARTYAHIGLKLLGEHAWTQYYEITLALYNLEAELAQLCGDRSGVECSYNAVVSHAHDLLDQVTVHCAKIRDALVRVERESAIELALSFTRQLGYPLAISPTPEDIQEAFGEVYQLTAEQPIAEFVNFPMTSDR
ncbi:MAG: serine/threonine-protein kinase PknK, partial [Cyanobacteria bacterium J06649_4]